MTIEQQDLNEIITTITYQLWNADDELDTTYEQTQRELAELLEPAICDFN